MKKGKFLNALTVFMIVLSQFVGVMGVSSVHAADVSTCSTQSYSHSKSSGDRTSLITMGGTVTGAGALIDGANSPFNASNDAAGNYYEFDFGSTVAMSELKWTYRNSWTNGGAGVPLGIYKVQASDDGETFFDISDPADMGTSTGNTTISSKFITIYPENQDTGYRYFRLMITGSPNNTYPNEVEVEFSLCDAIAPSDTTAPTDTTVVQYPSPVTNSTSATFEFSGTDDVSLPENMTYVCVLDQNEWEDPCDNPRIFTDLEDGPHAVWFYSRDEAGNQDPNIHRYDWVVDTTAPDAPVVSNPSELTNDSTPTVDGTAEADSYINVWYWDGEGWNLICEDVLVDELGNWSCDSSMTLPNDYIELAVNATDEAGNQSEDTSHFFNVDATAPSVVSIERYDPETSTTDADSLTFAVTFSEGVLNVNTADFLVNGETTAAVTNVQQVYSMGYNVTVSGGDLASLNGVVGLDLSGSQDIEDAAGNLLSADEPETDETYALANSTGPSIVVSKFNSTASQDGWILESSETSNLGGTMNNTAASLYVGDNAQDKQYRSYLSFDTSELPEGAVITSVQLRIKVQGFAGNDMFNPAKTHGNLFMDIRNGHFGSNADIAVNDFQAGVSLNKAGTLSSVPSMGWYVITLSDASYSFVNLAGSTQFRLRFQKDDNDDLGANYIKISSGDSPARPQLIVEYYIP